MKYFGIINKDVTAIFQLQWKIENISDMFLQYSVLCWKARVEDLAMGQMSNFCGNAFYMSWLELSLFRSVIFIVSNFWDRLFKNIRKRTMAQGRAPSPKFLSAGVLNIHVNESKKEIYFF